MDCIKSNPEIGVRSRFWSVPESLRNRGQTPISPNSRSTPRLPALRVAAPVHARNNDDEFWKFLVVQPVRESFEQRATGVAVYDLMEARIFAQQAQCGTQGLAKLVAQARPLGFVPGVSVFDVSGRGRPDEDGLHARRECRRPRTSSAGIPTGPSRSRSSSLRSSSSRCGSVSGIALGVAERLSQSFSRSCSCSAWLSVAISIMASSPNRGSSLLPSRRVSATASSSRSSRLRPALRAWPTPRPGGVRRPPLRSQSRSRCRR